MRALRRYSYGPSGSPEWGSGGVFGLKYHNGFLYYTLSFEAEAHFASDDIEKVYRFELVGPQPRSGGDTYNAVVAVDNKIFFGGWVHAPVRYLKDARRVDFTNKHSHVHVFDTDNLEVDLVWKECAGSPDSWVGEVSNILHDPLEQGLLISRGDGSQNLGIYSLHPGGGASRLSDRPSLKGALIGDLACFDMSAGFEGFKGIQCLDLVERRWLLRPFSGEALSADGGGIERAGVGAVASAYNRLAVFVRGGVFMWSPWEKEGEDLVFARLFDFPWTDYGPLRTSYVHLMGGVLIPFNAHTHGMLRPGDSGRDLARRLNTPPGPTVLAYMSYPHVRIMATAGARVTSLDVVGSKLVLGSNTQPNLGWEDQLPVDYGEKGIVEIDVGLLISFQGARVAFKILGERVGNKIWGGLPVGLSREAEILVIAGKHNTLRIYEYDLSTGPQQASEEKYEINRGRTSIDLKAFSGIVSFRLEEEDPKALMYVRIL